jgi:outer membrane protein assembly factor BamD
VRAEQEYRNLILQYPDSPLVPQAKERLRQVQEVLADREFLIGRFYYMRESWAAAEARLRSVIDTYPLFSGADEALYLLGQCYEGQVANVRAANINEVAKGKLIKAYDDAAAAAYARILTRYPVMGRAADAKARLEALHYQIPTPTKEAVAENQREEASRGELSFMGRMWSNFSSRPDVSLATKVGQPTLVDPQQTSATDLVKQASTMFRNAEIGATGNSGNNNVSVETVKVGQPPPNQPIPGTEPAAGSGQTSGPPQLESIPSAGSDATNSSPAGPAANPAAAANPAPAASSPGPDQTGIPELLPDSAKQADSAPVNTAPGTKTEAPPPAPPQLNQAEAQATGQKTQNDSKTDNKTDASESSSSRPKKKKGFLGVF